MSEVNIIETWQQLLAKYLFFMPKTFRDIDPATYCSGKHDGVTLGEPSSIARAAER